MNYAYTSTHIMFTVMQHVMLEYIIGTPITINDYLMSCICGLCN